MTTFYAEYPAGSDTATAITALTGDVSATGPGAVAATVNAVGGKTASNVASAVTTVDAAATAATPSTLAKRDSSGNLAAVGLALPGSTSGTVTQRANNVTTDYGVKWPAAQGSASTVLTNDGSGNLSWGSGGGGGVSIGSPVAGGTPERVLFIDDSGNLAQSSYLTYDTSPDLPLTPVLSLGALTPPTPTGEILALGTFGYSQLSLSFNGVNSYLSVPDAPALRPSTAFSVAFWAKENTTAAELVIFSKADYGANKRSLFIEKNFLNGRLGVFLSSNGTSNDIASFESTATFDPTAFHFYVVTYGNASGSYKVRVYKDASLTDDVAATAGPLFDTAGVDLLIGAIFNSGVPALFFDGSLDEITYSMSTEWSLATITSMYNSGQPDSTTGISGATANYRMGEQGDTTATIFDRINSYNASGHNLVADDFQLASPYLGAASGDVRFVGDVYLGYGTGADAIKGHLIFMGADDDAGDIRWDQDGGGDIGLPTGHRPENLYLSQNVSASLGVRLAYVPGDTYPTVAAGTVIVKPGTPLALTADTVVVSGAVSASYQRVAGATAGGSTTINDHTSTLVLQSVGTLATYTVTMPATPVDGQVVGITSNNVITALTVTGNGGQTVVGGSLSTFTLGQQWQWVAIDSLWYPL